MECILPLLYTMYKTSTPQKRKRRNKKRRFKQKKEKQKERINQMCRIPL